MFPKPLVTNGLRLLLLTAPPLRPPAPQGLDYEDKRDYEFRVEVRNTYLDARFVHGLQFKDYATVRVTVEDVDEPPVFTRNPYVIEVHEDTAAGSFVGVVSARDPDAENKPVK